MRAIWTWAARLNVSWLIVILLGGPLWTALPIASIAAPQAGRQAPASTTVNIEQIDAFVARQIQRHGLPGLALALVEGDRVIFMKGYGKADRTGRPVTCPPSGTTVSTSTFIRCCPCSQRPAAAW